MAKDQHAPKQSDGIAVYKFVYSVAKNNCYQYLPTEFNLDVDLGNVTELNESPLHFACKNNLYNFAEAFLTYGARVNEREKTIGATPCMLAAGAKGDTVPLLKLLIEGFKADISLIDNNGLDALKYAENSNNEAASVYLAGLHILEQEGA